MDRRALLVGIDHYDTLTPLHGCAADAVAMARLLARHADERPNYDCDLQTARDSRAPITRADLRGLLAATFKDARSEVAFFFAGHGALTDSGAFLCTSDAAAGDLGISMDEVLHFASRSPARSVLVILDCCHAGAFGNPGAFGDALAAMPVAVLRQDVTILTATRPSQTAMETDGHGAFTAALVQALQGGAADILGQVTAPDMYRFAERRFGARQQRPTYKSHATSVTTVRECPPAIDRALLRRLPEFFATDRAHYGMDPDYEDCDRNGTPRPVVNAPKVAIGQLFKKYRDAGLLLPSTAGEQLFWTAQESHTVELTHRGREYWWLVHDGRI